MRARIVQLTHQEQHLKERPWKSHLHIFDHKKMSQTHLICELKLDVDQTHLPVTSGNFWSLHPQLEHRQVRLDLGLQLVWRWFRLGALHEWRPKTQGIEGEFPWSLVELRMRKKIPKWLGNPNMFGKWKKIEIEQIIVRYGKRPLSQPTRNNTIQLKSQFAGKVFVCDAYSTKIGHHFGTAPFMWNHGSVWAGLWPRLLSNGTRRYKHSWSWIFSYSAHIYIYLYYIYDTSIACDNI